MQERVFWRVLAALARHGYAVPPSDGRDLIHDFYLDAWSGVNARFDPTLGSFATYVAAAFYRFARRRILKLESFHLQAVDLESALEEPSSEKTPIDILEHREQLQAVRTAMALLSPLEQRILNEFLTGAASSERQLALKHSMSRYGLREVLIDSVGKVALALGRVGALSEIEEKIVELLWKQGQSPRSVACLLNIPVVQVQGARNRLVSALLASLRKYESLDNDWRIGMNDNDALQLLRTALLSAGNQEEKRKIGAHALAIQQALEADDLVFNASEWSAIQKHPTWVAEIYESLAASDTTDSELGEDELSRVIDSIRANEQHEIGEAFALLMNTLPENFHDWNRWFHGLRPASKDYQAELSNRLSVQVAGEASVALLRYGLTPDTLFAATRGLELLFNRIERNHRENQTPRWQTMKTRSDSVLPAPVVLNFDDGRDPVQVSGKLILAEVAATPELPEGVETPLTHWIFDTLQIRPYLVDGWFMAVSQPETFSFQWEGLESRINNTRIDLPARWSRQHESGGGHGATL